MCAMNIPASVLVKRARQIISDTAATELLLTGCVAGQGKRLSMRGPAIAMGQCPAFSPHTCFGAGCHRSNGSRLSFPHYC